jgi:hypothetical protein
MRGKILDEVRQIINGDREDSYGDPEDSFSRIADYWNGFLRPWGTEQNLIKLQSADVAIMMVLLKLARWEVKADHDSVVDAIGYLALAADLEGQ